MEFDKYEDEHHGGGPKSTPAGAKVAAAALGARHLLPPKGGGRGGFTQPQVQLGTLQRRSHLEGGAGGSAGRSRPGGQLKEGDTGMGTGTGKPTGLGTGTGGAGRKSVHWDTNVATVSRISTAARQQRQQQSRGVAPPLCVPSLTPKP